MEFLGSPSGIPANVILLLAWSAAWVCGGIMLVSAAFRLAAREKFMVGLGAGWIAQTITANLFARIIPLPLASWLGAAVVLISGAVLYRNARKRNQPSFAIPYGQFFSFILLASVFTLMARGLGLFDDYAHMPTLSIMATGEIPPRFALDPAVSYGYHYLLLSSAAEMMRIGSLLPWTALDLARGVSLALCLLLTCLWVQRLTGSSVAGVLGAAFFMFATGTRWLLVFLPERTLLRVSESIQLIGSGASSGADLFEALVSPWGIDGAGSFPFPFAFSNGIAHPGFLAIGDVNGAFITVLSLLLLLTFNRWNGWRGAVISALLVSAITLVNEVSVVLMVVGWAAITLIYVLQKRSFRLPSSLWQWWLVLIVGNLAGLLLGGAMGDMLGFFLGSSQGTAESYQTVGFQVMRSPAVVSSHLGVLWLTKPGNLLAAAAEVGPILLVLPLVAIFGWKALRAGRWYEAAFITGCLLSVVLVMVQFTGSTGVRNTSRLYGFIGLCYLFAFPLGWLWARRRNKFVQTTVCALALLVTTGGFVSFTSAMIAAPRPVAAPFINNLDIEIMQQVWNRLESDALVFDPDPYRAPTVTGRYMDAHRTWFEPKPEYQLLQNKPLLTDLQSAGYAYAYFDEASWRKWDSETRASLTQSCIRTVASAESPLGFRRLIDLRGCAQ